MANANGHNGRLQARHKHFFCQCFAEFMEIAEVTTGFVEKFSDEFVDKIGEIGKERLRLGTAARLVEDRGKDSHV